MTIEEIVGIARRFAYGSRMEWPEPELRAAISALVAQARDEEAEDFGYELVELVANDASAITFQTMGQYRTALLESMAQAIRARIAGRKA